jgi:hypothetical protein
MEIRDLRVLLFMQARLKYHVVCYGLVQKCPDVLGCLPALSSATSEELCLSLYSDTPAGDLASTLSSSSGSTLASPKKSWTRDDRLLPSLRHTPPPVLTRRQPPRSL